MGLPPDIPLILDRGLTEPFKEVFDAIDEWQRDPQRELTDLPKFAAQLPELEDVIIDGRSVLGVSTRRKEVAGPTRTSSKTCSWPPSGSRWSTGST